MEIERIIYKAKDGRIFFDPIECEEYEKTIGILQGSVGDLIAEMEKQCKREDYIHAIVKIMDGTKSTIFVRTTMCADSLLVDYVNVSNLTQQQRYFISTAGELIDTLKQLNKDLPCQYFIVFGDIEFKNTGCFANHNKLAWGKDSWK